MAYYSNRPQYPSEINANGGDILGLTTYWSKLPKSLKYNSDGKAISLVDIRRLRDTNVQNYLEKTRDDIVDNVDDWKDFPQPLPVVVEPEVKYNPDLAANCLCESKCSDKGWCYINNSCPGGYRSIADLWLYKRRTCASGEENNTNDNDRPTYAPSTYTNPDFPTISGPIGGGNAYKYKLKTNSNTKPKTAGRTTSKKNKKQINKK